MMYQPSSILPTPLATMATETSLRSPPICLASRKQEEMIRIKRLQKNLANAHPDVLEYARRLRYARRRDSLTHLTRDNCTMERAAETRRNLIGNYLKRDSKSLGMEVGKTLYHRERLIKLLGVFGMVANSEERNRLYKNWVRFTKDGLRNDEQSLSAEYRELTLNFMIEKNRIQAKMSISSRNRPGLKRSLGEIQVREEQAAEAYVRECRKLRKQRVKMKNKIKKIKDSLGEWSQFPQGDLAKIWGEGYGQVTKAMDRKNAPKESQSGEISEEVSD